MFRLSPRCLRNLRINRPKELTGSFRVLGIETSCDDTCVAVVDIEEGSRPVIRHNVVRRSLKLSEPYGGIVPMLVGMFHAKELGKALTEVRDKGGFEGLDLIAVTRGPGIPMCLAGGLNHAKGLSVGLNVPIIGVHHMQAHALTPRLLSPTRDPQFPFYTLLISGGHTMLVYSTSVTEHQIIINTRDTAIGDYLDKVARVLEVPWGDKMPGAALEQWSLINDVNETVISRDIGKWGLTKPLSVYKKNVPAFSFTGLRTMVERVVEANKEMTEEDKKSLGRAAQVLVFEHVSEKCILGMMSQKLPGGSLVVSGGVACNAALRRIMRQTLDRHDLEEYNLVFPPIEFCTDNAAMIAWAGYEMFQEGYISDFGITQLGKWPLDELVKKTLDTEEINDTKEKP